MWEKGRARRKDEKSPDVGPRAQVRAQATVVTSETSSAAGLGSCLVAPALQAQPQQGCEAPADFLTPSQAGSSS